MTVSPSSPLSIEPALRKAYKRRVQGDRNMSALLLLAMLAAESPPAGTASTPAPRPGKVVCKYETRIGTLAGRKRVCHTAAEWDQIAARARGTYEAVQGAHGSSASQEPDIIRAQGGSPQ